MRGKANFSYEYLIFQELLYEYDSSQQNSVEGKIKRRLKYYQVGPYNKERVAYIRNFKNELSSEIRLMSDSKYFKNTTSQFAKIEDFNIEQMVKDYAKQFDQLSMNDIRDMIGWGVHWLYTR